MPQTGEKSRTKEEVMIEILNRRGYIVIWQKKHVVYRIGEIVPGLGRENIKLGQPFAVISRTNLADFIEQQKLSKELAPNEWGKKFDPVEYVMQADLANIIFSRVGTD